MKRSRFVFSCTIAIGLNTLPAAAATRMFMAKLGEEGSAANTGNTTVRMGQSETVTIGVFFHDDRATGKPSGYGVELPYSATPIFAAGSVDYVDNPPTGAVGNSIASDTSRTDFMLFGNVGSGPFYSEGGTSFAATTIVPPCNPSPGGPGIFYVAEFQLASSSSSLGIYELSFLDQNGNTSVTADDCGSLYIIDEYQDLTIIVGSACCDRAQLGGTCLEVFTEPQCLENGPDGVPDSGDEFGRPVWHEDMNCAQVEAEGLCEGDVGACCRKHQFAKWCDDGVFEEDCMAEGSRWIKDSRCADVRCSVFEIDDIVETDSLWDNYWIWTLGAAFLAFLVYWRSRRSEE